ncbi:MAG: MATE family efflux transporter [Clostridia bacterium]
MATELTTGNPERVLWRYSLPLFGSVVFQQLYNIADSVVAGKFIGENALAAVGNSYEVTLIYLAFAVGLNIGVSVVTARLFGAKRVGELKTAINTAFLFSTALCVALMAIGFLFSPALLHAIRTPDEIFSDTLLYLNIYTGGLPFLFLYNIATGIFAALGDSKTPFWFLAASSISNIALDILFVAEFHMGVAGVAWATFLCQGVSCLLAVWALLRHVSRMQADEKPRLFSMPILGSIIRIALPSTLQQSFISVGNILIQSIINGFGTSAIAGYAAAVKFNNFAVTSFSTLGNGMSNFTAQNLGAGLPKRVRQGLRASLKLMAVVVTCFAAVYLLFGNQVIRLFLNAENAEALTIGVQFLKVVSPFYYVVAIKLATDGVLRGAGRMDEFMIDTLTDLVLRVALAFALALPFGILGVWWSWPIGWALGTLLSVFFYRRGRWESLGAQKG